MGQIIDNILREDTWNSYVDLTASIVDAIAKRLQLATCRQAHPL